VAEISLPTGGRKTFYGKTRAEVAKLLTRALADLERGLPVVQDERQTIATYLRAWLATDSQRLAVRTIEARQLHIERYLIPAFGGVRLTKLTTQHLHTLYTQLVASGLSTTYVRHMHETIHKALVDALELGMVVRNVADSARPPRYAKREMQTLSQEQCQRLLGTARQMDADEGLRGYLAPLLTLALASGMREGELLALRWRWVDFATGWLTVAANLIYDQRAHEYRIKEPKTERGRRTITLDAPVLAVLRQHQERQQTWRAEIGAEVWLDNDLVFPNELGGPHTASVALHKLQRALKRAGLPHIRFHDLRHTCATLLIAAGVPANVVAAMLGHADISTTLSIYSHVLPSMQTTAAQTISQAILGPTGDAHGNE
jgi:integrase